jgi:hypothetical protein
MKFQELNIRVINVSMNYILDGSVRGELEQVHAGKCTSDIHEGNTTNYNNKKDLFSTYEMSAQEIPNLNEQSGWLRRAADVFLRVSSVK